MEYSIVIPVFNREDLTQQCLSALPSTLDGRGEVIVVDNGSGPATAATLAQHPWVRVVRNETNLGFAAACNQGARAAQGRYLVHLNNDTVPLRGWLATLLRVFEDHPDVGVVGAKLLFPNGTIQHAGVASVSHRFGPEGLGPYHFAWGRPSDLPLVNAPVDLDAVTGACLVTSRDLFLELGGFDESYWNGYEDIDYCYKVRATGRRIRYEPRSVVYHYESQSGAQRKRRVTANLATFGRRWAGRRSSDMNRHNPDDGAVTREVYGMFSREGGPVAMPPITLFVHGSGELPTAPVTPRGRLLPIATTIRVEDASAAVAAARDAMEVRGDRYFAIVNAAAALDDTWLSHLINTIEFGEEVVAATFVGSLGRPGDHVPISADARCTLLNLRNLPQDLRLRDHATLDAALADLLIRAGERGRVVRATDAEIGTLPAIADDASFTERYGIALDEVAQDDRTCARRLYAIVRSERTSDELATIVMLSWNAPEYTKTAVDSIREYTSGPYEIVIVDNGSRPETIAALRELDDVRVIYNATNMGFAHGCNQGIAAARGRYVLLLNNDVVVTEGWLDGLIDAHRRDPLVGVSAPRSNRVAGHQQINDTRYDDIAQMHAYAAERRRKNLRASYQTDRAIGFCLCIERRVIDEVGGIDPRYKTGNFEDDDFCMRVRAAGYRINVCNDVFIHHFGNVSFNANNVDYMATMQRNWTIFAERWGYPAAYPKTGYLPAPAIARGFDRRVHYVPLPAAEPARVEELAREYRLGLFAIVRDERDWGTVAPTLSNYLSTFRAGDPVLFAIAATGSLDIHTIERRIERAIDRAGVDASACADVALSDDRETWRSERVTRGVRVVKADPELQDVPLLEARNPAGLSRLLQVC